MGFPQVQDEDGHSGPFWLSLVSSLQGSGRMEDEEEVCLAVSPGASVGARGPGGAASFLKATRWSDWLMGLPEGGPREEFPPRGSRDHSHLCSPPPADPPASRGRVDGGWA